MRAALFITCLADEIAPELAKATVILLRRLGVDVEVPMGQSCCGQAHINTGYPREAFPLVRGHVLAFEGYDYIVAPSGSCTASIRHQHAQVARLRDDEPLAVAAEAVASRTYELSEFLVDVLQTQDVGAYFPHQVTYHPTCHSMRLLRVGDRLLRLLRAVKNPDVSGAMLADKTAAIAATGAGFCAAGDASCLLHIGGGLSRQGARARTIHLAQILASTRERVLA